MMKVVCSGYWINLSKLGNISVKWKELGNIYLWFSSCWVYFWILIVPSSIPLPLRVNVFTTCDKNYLLLVMSCSERAGCYTPIFLSSFICSSWILILIHHIRVLVQSRNIWCIMRKPFIFLVQPTAKVIKN